MNRQFITNDHNQVLGVKYKDTSIDQIDPSNTAKQLAKQGIIVIKNSGATPEQFAEWNYEMSYHLSPQVWCTDKEHSDLFWRVTNQFVDGKHRGLKADHELDWHVNINPVLDAEEIIGLYGKTITYPTETWICNSIPFWNEQDEETKKLWRSLTVVHDPKRVHGRMQEGGWVPDWKNYSDEIIEDIQKNRRTRNISKARNMEPENADKYQPSRGILENIKFVPEHPLGGENFFFSPYEIHTFLDENGEPHPQAKELYWHLWNDYVESGKYTYVHKWEEGDIILMDQVRTIHKRPASSFQLDKPRELLRTASWYKTRDRVHTNYTF